LNLLKNDTNCGAPPIKEARRFFQAPLAAAMQLPAASTVFVSVAGKHFPAPDRATFFLWPLHRFFEHTSLFG